MVLSATPTVRMDTQVSAPSAGRTALMTVASVTTVHTATSLMLMVVALVRSTNALAAKNGDLCGTPSATITSIMSAAASAPQTALRV